MNKQLLVRFREQEIQPIIQSETLCQKDTQFRFIDKMETLLRITHTLRKGLRKVNEKSNT